MCTYIDIFLQNELNFDQYGQSDTYRLATNKLLPSYTHRRNDVHKNRFYMYSYFRRA